MNSFDPHHVLGLTAPVSATQVRKAFRRLAMLWHPDRNSSPEAAERFRQIRAAHDALLIEVDELDLEDDPTPRGPVEEAELTVSLEEAIQGARKSFTVVRENPCDECHGSKEVTLQFSRLCSPCHGTGRIRGPGGLTRCGVCEGKGYRFKAPCETCDGRGHIRSERELSVVVPPLSVDGQILRLSGQGPGPEECPGDLLLVIRHQAHPLFQTQKEDLHLAMPVSILAWLAGQALEVPVPGGTAELLVPVGGQSRRFTLKGQGLPRGNRTRGDLVVELEPHFPEALDPAALKLLRQLDRHLTANEGRHFPEVAAWRQRVGPVGTV